MSAMCGPAKMTITEQDSEQREEAKA